jgi:hybrid polyketide synthase/nonribosomal peptide synthetase ACE1
MASEKSSGSPSPSSGGYHLEGRISGDTQVKIRGIRVDMREIEAAMIKSSHGLLSEAAVSFRRSSEDLTEFLVAHIVFERQLCEEQRNDLVRSLPSSFSLPKYMISAVIIPLQQFPRTNSGKLDRKVIGSLPISQHICNDEDNMPVELSQTEGLLADVWLEVIQKRIIHKSHIVPETDFFNAGGTSLLILHIQARILENLRVKVTVSQLFEASSLGDMARLIEYSHVPLNEPIVWEYETSFSPDYLGWQSSSTPVQRTDCGMVVVLTGSTGYLGRALLGSLIRDTRIK